VYAEGVGEMSSFTFTLFPDLSGSQSTEHTTDIDGLEQWLRDMPERPNKAACPLVSFARYGNQRTAKGSLRHDANILSMTGLTGDYDQGELEPATAAAIIELAGIEAMVVTTPSHGVRGNRWRVIVPFATERTTEERHTYLGKLNALLDGALAKESFTASQAFYAGRVTGVRYEIHTSTGVPIDVAPGIEANGGDG